LFQQWGSTFAVIVGVMWFGLLFFAGITSSLAMGSPWIAFMRDEFKWNRNKSAWAFGLIIFALGLPTVLFFNEGVFDEYDYWAGHGRLGGFCTCRSYLVFVDIWYRKGWNEINEGAEIQVPLVFKFIIKYVTPVFIGAVFIGSLPDIYAKITGETSLYINLSRLLLVAVFLGICYLVYLAHAKRV
jgi:NSS family neurotransmitter:Na+ symporter